MPKSLFTHEFRQQLLSRWMIPVRVMILLAILIQLTPYVVLGQSATPTPTPASVMEAESALTRAPLGSPIK